MHPPAIERLIELFSKLPGVGPRQAARMAFFLLRESSGYSTLLANAIETAMKEVGACARCFKSVQKARANGEGLCEICADAKRDQNTICLVEKELDIPNIEKTGAFSGTYHVLGGTLSLLDKESPERLRLKELYRRTEKLAEGRKPAELIIAVSPTANGDATALYLKRTLEPLAQKYTNFKISALGRGLSLGAEIEYADEVTLENALKNRTAAA